MSTRRGFLISTLAVAAVPVVARSGMLGTAPVVRVITESICADTSSFAQRFGIGSCVSGGDPAEFLFDLERELSNNKLDFIFGLTRSSTQFLVEQIAIPHGYRLTYHGHHRYTDQQLIHTLNGSRKSIDVAAQRLKINTDSWASDLADTVEVLQSSDKLTQQYEFKTARELPSDSSRHLVSWLLKLV